MGNGMELHAQERPTVVVVFGGLMPRAFVDLFVSEKGLEVAGEFPALSQATKKTRVAVAPLAPCTAEQLKKDLLASQFVESVEIPVPKDAKAP